MTPWVVAEPPPGRDWVVADVARPPVGEAADARLTSFAALRSPDGAETLVTACVSASIPGWVEDMRPPIEARLVGIVAYSAGQVTGVPMEARPDAGDLALHVAGGPRRGTARTFVGFEPGRVATCYAMCLGAPLSRPNGDVGPDRSRACDASVAAARLEGSAPAPPPGAALRAVSWAVYHPTETAIAAGALASVAAVLAVVRRRKPRARI